MELGPSTSRKQVTGCYFVADSGNFGVSFVMLSMIPLRVLCQWCMLTLTCLLEVYFLLSRPCTTQNQSLLSMVERSISVHICQIKASISETPKLTSPELFSQSNQQKQGGIKNLCVIDRDTVACGDMSARPMANIRFTFSTPRENNGTLPVPFI